MTIDSAYYIKLYEPDDDTLYRFDTESIGGEAMQVWIEDAQGVAVQLTEDIDFTFSFPLDEQPIYRRGSLTLNAPLSEGLVLSLRRKTPIINELQLTEGARFPAEQFEFMMDKICFIQQEIEGSYCDCREFVDPPVPVPCKVYECDAYDTYMLSAAMDLMSYSGTDEVPPDDYLIDKTVNGRDSNTNIDLATGPYLKTAGIDTCDDAKDNYVSMTRNIRTRWDAPAPASTSDIGMLNVSDNVTIGCMLANAYLPTTYGGWTIFAWVVGDDPGRFNLSVQAYNDATNGWRLGFTFFDQANVNVYQHTVWTAYIPELTAVMDNTFIPFPFAVHLDRSGGDAAPYTFDAIVYVNNEVVLTQTFTGAGASVTGNGSYPDNGDGLIRLTYTETDDGGAGMNVWGSRYWFKAGPLSPTQLTGMADALSQNNAGYIDPDPRCGQATCKEYECDAYYNQVLALTPNIYWPMNIQSDLDAYPTSKLIPDYSGNDNGIPWGNQAIGDLSTAPQPLDDYDACGPNVTALKNNNGSNLDDRVDPYIEGVPITNDFTWIGHVGEFATPGTLWGQLFNLRASQVPIATNPREISILIMNEVGNNYPLGVQFTGSLNTVRFDIESIDPNWKSKLIGVRASYDAQAASTTIELLIDFVVVGSDTQAGTILNGVDNLITYVLANAQGRIQQEHSYWSRKLSDAEILGLKSALQQNDINYIDPSYPNCGQPGPGPGPNPEYQCDIYEETILPLVDYLWPATEVGAGDTLTPLKGGWTLYPTIPSSVSFTDEQVVDTCTGFKAAQIGSNSFAFEDNIDRFEPEPRIQKRYIGSFGHLIRFHSTSSAYVGLGNLQWGANLDTPVVDDFIDLKIWRDPDKHVYLNLNAQATGDYSSQQIIWTNTYLNIDRVYSIILNYEFVENTSNWSFELFLNGLSMGVKSGQRPFGLIFSPDIDRDGGVLELGTGGFQSNLSDINYSHFSNHHMTEEQAAALYAAAQQNIL